MSVERLLEERRKAVPVHQSVPQYRYTIGNTPTQGFKLITQPVSDIPISADQKGSTDTYDMKGSCDEQEQEELNSLQERKNSNSSESESCMDQQKDCGVSKDKTEGNTRRISDSEESSFGDNSDWNKMDSLDKEESYEECQNNRGDLQVNDNTVSVDAISMNEQSSHRQDAYHPGESFQATSDCFKASDLPGDDKFVCKQSPESNGQWDIRGENLTSVKFFDAVVVYAKEDMCEVLEFVHYLHATVNYEFNFVPEIELYDQGMFCSSHVAVVEDVLNRSGVVFVYLTRNTNSEHLHLFIDEAVSLSRLRMNPAHVMAGRRTTDRQWALKPVHTLPARMRDYKTPAGLVSCRGIDWFDKDSQHTRSTVVSILKEARRIREEAERMEIGNIFQSHRLHNIVHPPFVASKEKFTSRGAPAYQQPFSSYNHPMSTSVTNTGDVKIRFRPSARPQRPPVNYHSPGPPANQPPSYLTSQQMYGLPKEDPRINVNPRVQTHQIIDQSRVSMNNFPSPAPRQVFHDSNTRIPVYQPHPNETTENHQRVADLDIDNRQSIESAQSSQSYRRSFDPHEGNNERQQSRRHRSGQKYRNRFSGSESETSSTDEDEDFEDTLPAKFKKKRNINIIGCKFVQLGTNNRVLDRPTLSKRKIKSSRRVRHDDSDEDESIGSDSKTTSKHKDEANEKEQDVNQTAQFQSEPHQVPSVVRSSQTFNSSVLEDNLDISNISLPYDSHKHVLSKTSKSSKDKDLTFVDLKKSGVCDVNVNVESQKVDNVKSTSDNEKLAPCIVSNVKLKKPEDLKEYQLTVKGKQKDVFVNDLDKVEDDDESLLLGRSVADQNICLESSGEDNNAFSEDQEVSENESHTNSLLKEQNDSKRSTAETCENFQKKRPVQKFLPLPKVLPKHLDFMVMIKTLNIIPAAKSTASPDTNVKLSSELSEDDVE